MLNATMRGYLIDHHSPAPPIITLENLNPAEYEQFFQEANINHLMLYTKDHWGYSYYDTKIGTKHPALKGDWVAEMAAVMRKQKIEFTAYYCIEYDTLAPVQHPEWSILDINGHPFTCRDDMCKWGMPCYETGYRDYVLGQLAEVVSNYAPDNLFLDIFGKTLCYCPSCQKKFKEKYGYDLPQNNTVVDDKVLTYNFEAAGRDVNEFLEDSATQMLEEIIKELKRIKPDLNITLNFSALYPKKIRDLLDYQFTEPWAGNWLSAAYSRDTAIDQYPQLGPGDVSEVYNYKADAIYDLAAAEIAAQGCRVFMYSGSQHVDGTLEHVEAIKIGKAYDNIQQFEHLLTDREVVADIAIIQSDSSSIARSGNHVVANAIGRCKKLDIHKEHLLGAMQLCDESKYSWKIMPEQIANEDTLKNIKVVILPGVFHMTEKLKSTLSCFVEQGGVLISDSGVGLYNLDGSQETDYALTDVLGCNYVGLIDEYKKATWGGYVTPIAHPVWNATPATTPPLPSIQYKVQKTTAQALGYITNPTVELTACTWVNWWCPPPKMAHTEFPAILENNYVGGKSVYFAYDFFRNTSEFHLNSGIFKGILEYVLPLPSIQLQTSNPNSIGIVSYAKGEQLVIHVVSHLAQKTNGDAPLIESGVLRMSKQLKAIVNCEVFFPEKQKLNVLDCGSYYEIPLPSVAIHQIIVVQ